jgi:hypothetical protein
MFCLGMTEAWWDSKTKDNEVLVVHRNKNKNFFVAGKSTNFVGAAFSKQTRRNWVHGPFIQVPIAALPLALNPIILQSPTWATLGKMTLPFGIATWMIAACYDNTSKLPKGIYTGLVFYGIQLVRSLCIVLKEGGKDQNRS